MTRLLGAAAAAFVFVALPAVAAVTDQDCVIAAVSAEDIQAIQAAADRDIADFMAMKPIAAPSTAQPWKGHLNVLAQNCAKARRWTDEGRARAFTYTDQRLYFEAIERNLIGRGFTKAKLEQIWAALTPQDREDLNQSRATERLMRDVVAIVDRVGPPAPRLSPIILMYLGFRNDLARSEARLDFR